MEGEPKNKTSNTFDGLVMTIFNLVLHESQHEIENKDPYNYTQKYDAEDPEFESGLRFEKNAYGGYLKTNDDQLHLNSKVNQNLIHVDDAAESLIKTNSQGEKVKLTEQLGVSRPNKSNK